MKARDWLGEGSTIGPLPGPHHKISTAHPLKLPHCTPEGDGLPVQRDVYLNPGRGNQAIEPLREPLCEPLREPRRESLPKPLRRLSMDLSVRLSVRLSVSLSMRSEVRNSAKSGTRPGRLR